VQADRAFTSDRGSFYAVQPVQRPIPIWFGGSSDAAVTRAARLGDGWMPIMAADAQAEQKLGTLRDQLKLFGR
jgi:alkanesulfonate monooxygenase SsuD/methylene tetrahydromethanopterin reductase-like flavin-dependent oxidoreductase (luciferase family)